MDLPPHVIAASYSLAAAITSGEEHPDDSARALRTVEIDRSIREFVEAQLEGKSIIIMEPE